METLKCSLKRKVKPPLRAGKHQAGIDLFVPEFNQQFLNDLKSINEETLRCFKIQKDHIILNAHGRIKIPSGVHFNVPHGNCLFVMQKTSTGSTGLFTGGRVADSSFLGEITIALNNVSDQPIIITEHQKFIQLVMVPIRLDHPELVPFEELYIGKESQRGEGCFGSTGKY